MRSSWLASATKRRSRSSDARASASGLLARNAVSIWPSIPLSDADSRPISVRGRTRARAGTGRPRRSRGGRLDLVQRAEASGARSTRPGGEHGERDHADDDPIRMSRPTVSSMPSQRLRDGDRQPAADGRDQHPPALPVLDGAGGERLPRQLGACAASRSGRSGVEASRPPTGSIDRAARRRRRRARRRSHRHPRPVLRAPGRRRARPRVRAPRPPGARAGQLLVDAVHQVAAQHRVAAADVAATARAASSRTVRPARSAAAGG